MNSDSDANADCVCVAAAVARATGRCYEKDTDSRYAGMGDGCNYLVYWLLQTAAAVDAVVFVAWLAVSSLLSVLLLLLMVLFGMQQARRPMFG